MFLRYTSFLTAMTWYIFRAPVQVQHFRSIISVEEFFYLTHLTLQYHSHWNYLILHYCKGYRLWTRSALVSYPFQIFFHLGGYHSGLQTFQLEYHCISFFCPLLSLLGWHVLWGSFKAIFFFFLNWFISNSYFNSFNTFFFFNMQPCTFSFTKLWMCL